MKKHLLSLFIFFSGVLVSQAQWVSTGGPSSGSNRCLAVSDTNLFVGTWPSGGIFRSGDNGSKWALLDFGITDPYINALTIKEDTIFAAAFGGVYHSANNGTNWTTSSIGLSNTDVVSLLISNSNLFCGTYKGVFLSGDNGTNWTEVNTGFPIDSSPFIVDALAVIDNTVFAGTDGYGVYSTTDSGANWAEMNVGLTNDRVFCLAVNGTNLFAGTLNGIYRSVDYGANWEKLQGMAGSIINTLAVSGTNIFAGSNSGNIQLSTDNGSTWTSVGIGMPNTDINALAAGNTMLYAATLSGKVYRRELTEMIPTLENIHTEKQAVTSLIGNYPNPFTLSTTINFTAGKGNWLTLKVYDLHGNAVATLFDEYKPAGNYKINFDALNLAMGVYYYTLKSGNIVSTKKMLLLK